MLGSYCTASKEWEGNDRSAWREERRARKASSVAAACLDETQIAGRRGKVKEGRRDEPVVDNEMAFC